MRDVTFGIVIGAAAIVLAGWYLSRTGGALFPTSLSTLVGPGANFPAAGGCNCQGGNTGYLAAPVRGAGQPPAADGWFQ